MASKPCFQPRLLLHFRRSYGTRVPFSTTALRMTMALGLCVAVFSVITACSSAPKQQETSKKPLSGTDEQIFMGDSIKKNYDPNVIMKRERRFSRKRNMQKPSSNITISSNSTAPTS